MCKIESKMVGIEQAIRCTVDMRVGKVYLRFSNTDN